MTSQEVTAIPNEPDKTVITVELDLPEGIDIDRFMRNPVVIWNGRRDLPPIGRVLSLEPINERPNRWRAVVELPGVIIGGGYVQHDGDAGGVTRPRLVEVGVYHRYDQPKETVETETST